MSYQSDRDSEAKIREEATRQLEAAAQDNFVSHFKVDLWLKQRQNGYLHTLALELANEQTAAHIRRAAGLAFKNALAARVSLGRSMWLTTRTPSINPSFPKDGSLFLTRPLLP